MSFASEANQDELSRSGVGAENPASKPVAIRRPVRGPYAPGIIRRESDYEHRKVAGYIKRHPEYAGLPHELVLQAVDTERTEIEREEERTLADEGVPQDWSDPDQFTDEVHTSDDL